MNALATPDITPAQIVALAKVALAVAVSFGLTLTGNQTEAIISAVSLVAPAIVLLLADAKIRAGRAAMKAAGGAPDALVADR